MQVVVIHREIFSRFKGASPLFPLFPTAGILRANGRVASAFVFEPRTFPLGRPRPWMSAAVLLQYRNQKQKRHHESYFENEEGGCARTDSEGTNNEGKDTRKPLTEIKH